MNKNCLLCGVGGQGTVLASRILAQAAMKKGYFARTAETIGMAQRGGCVVSHVRVGQTASPLIAPGEADVLVGFEPGEAVRCLPWLKPGGRLIVNCRAVQPVTAQLGGQTYSGEAMIDFLRAHVPDVIVLDGEEVARRCGSSKALNMALLGAVASSGAMGLTLNEVRDTLSERIPAAYLEMNLKALEMGAACAKGEIR